MTIRGAAVARTIRLLVERDGTSCGRCGGIVDVGLTGMVPAGPTIGHRVPGSRGGSDALGNLQLEHRRCNLAGGNRLTPPRATIARPILEG